MSAVQTSIPACSAQRTAAIQSGYTRAGSPRFHTPIRSEAQPEDKQTHPPKVQRIRAWQAKRGMGRDCHAKRSGSPVST